MKSLFAFLLPFLFAASAFAEEQLDCNSFPLAPAIFVGQISPTKARAYLKTGVTTPELSALEIAAGKSTLQDALNLGLAIQKRGNESMIYDLDALTFVVQDQDLMNIFAEITAAEVDGMSYYPLVQASAALRVVGRLHLNQRHEEARRVTNMVQDSLNDGLSAKPTWAPGHKLVGLRRLMSSTGKFSTPQKSKAFCKLLQ